MNKNTSTLKSVLVSLSLALVAVTGFAACAAPVDSGDGEASVANVADEHTTEAQQPVQNECCYSYYSCPTTGARWNWYSGPAAYCFVEGSTLAGTAWTQCNAACGPTCVGHASTCYPIN